MDALRTGSVFIALLVLLPLGRAFDIKPGLWKLESTVEMDGKMYNPQAEMKKLLDKMPVAQRKQTEAAVTTASKGQTAGLNDDGSASLCYSKEMLKNPESLAPEEKGCKMDFKEKSAKKLKGTFKCKDGMTGTVEWLAIGQDRFEGHVIGKDAKGRNSKVNYKGKFAAANCGALKPLNAN